MDIHVYINCPGGPIGEVLAVYDTLQQLTCDVATYCVGIAFGLIDVVLYENQAAEHEN